MENLVSINHTKENVLDFEMTIEGADIADVSAKFVIVTKGMELQFDATLEDKKAGKWNVKIPALSFLEKTAYKCYVAVVADGYYFEPMKGTLNVVGTAEVYVSAPKNAKLETTEKSEEKKTEKKEKPKTEGWKRQGEKPIEQLARELMEKQKYEPDQIDKKVEQIREAADEAGVDTEGSKDKKVLAILEEFGVKPKKEKRPRISFIKTQKIN